MSKEYDKTQLETRDTFADIVATILDIFKLKGDIDGESFWDEIGKEK
jgi:Phosphopentomutase